VKIESDHIPFFWLHIKKNAGISTRALLQPHYTCVDRVQNPYTFVQAPKREHNDILNNYRIPLGDYQFKRALFAKKYLYTENWEKIQSFAFSRNPTQRCISAFFYLYYRKGFRGCIRNIYKAKTFNFGVSRNFDAFLGFVEQAQNSQSVYKPIDLHFTTHTAPMWGDVTDERGDVILTRIFRLENLEAGIRTVYDACDLPAPKIEIARQNVNQTKLNFSPNATQLKKIETLYARDFEIYEGMCEF
jgi:hypothetical protein